MTDLWKGEAVHLWSHMHDKWLLCTNVKQVDGMHHAQSIWEDSQAYGLSDLWLDGTKERNQLRRQGDRTPSLETGETE